MREPTAELESNINDDESLSELTDNSEESFASFFLP